MINFLLGLPLLLFRFPFFATSLPFSRFLFAMVGDCGGFGSLLVNVAETDGGRLMRMVCFQPPLTPSLICKPQQHPSGVKAARLTACQLFSPI